MLTYNFGFAQCNDSKKWWTITAFYSDTNPRLFFVLFGEERVIWIKLEALSIENTCYSSTWWNNIKWKISIIVGSDSGGGRILEGTFWRNPRTLERRPIDCHNYTDTRLYWIWCSSSDKMPCVPNIRDICVNIGRDWKLWHDQIDQ